MQFPRLTPAQLIVLQSLYVESSFDTSAEAYRMAKRRVVKEVTGKNVNTINNEVNDAARRFGQHSVDEPLLAELASYYGWKNRMKLPTPEGTSVFTFLQSGAPADAVRLCWAIWKDHRHDWKPSELRKLKEVWKLQRERTAVKGHFRAAELRWMCKRAGIEDPEPEATSLALVGQQCVQPDLNGPYEGWAREVYAGQTFVRSDELDDFLANEGTIKAEHGGKYKVASKLWQPGVARVQKWLREAETPVNEGKVRLASDLGPGMITVRTEDTAYPSGVATNLLAPFQVFENSELLFRGSDLYSSNTSWSLQSSLCSNHIGVNIVILCYSSYRNEATVILQLQRTAANPDSAGKLVPSGSGSLDRIDFAGSSYDLNTAVSKGAEREFLEEAGWASGTEVRSFTIGYTRHVNLAGKPDFYSFGLVRDCFEFNPDDYAVQFRHLPVDRATESSLRASLDWHCLADQWLRLYPEEPLPEPSGHLLVNLAKARRERATTSIWGLLRRLA